MSAGFGKCVSSLLQSTARDHPLLALQKKSCGVISAGSSIWMKYVGDSASSVCTHPEILVFTLQGTNRVDVVLKGPIRTKRLSREAKEDHCQRNAAAIALKSNEIIREKSVKTTPPRFCPPTQRAL